MEKIEKRGDKYYRILEEELNEEQVIYKKGYLIKKIEQEKEMLSSYEKQLDNVCELISEIEGRRKNNQK